MVQQLTTNGALICYGLGGVTAFAGWKYDIAFLIMGMALLFGVSIILTFGE